MCQQVNEQLAFNNLGVLFQVTLNSKKHDLAKSQSVTQRPWVNSAMRINASARGLKLEKDEA